MPPSLLPGLLQRASRPWSPSSPSHLHAPPRAPPPCGGLSKPSATSMPFYVKSSGLLNPCWVLPKPVGTQGLHDGSGSAFPLPPVTPSSFMRKLSEWSPRFCPASGPLHILVAVPGMHSPPYLSARLIYTPRRLDEPGALCLPANLSTLCCRQCSPHLSTC